LQKIMSSTQGEKNRDASRSELLRRMLAEDTTGIWARLGERFRLRWYLMDRADQVRPLEVDSPAPGNAPGIIPGIIPEAHGVTPWASIPAVAGPAAAQIAKQMQATGPVTAIGAALNDLARRHQGQPVAGVVMFSDFDNNAGPDPGAAAKTLGAPLFTVGLGPTQAVDLSVSMQAPLIVKKGERVAVAVTLRQTGLTGRHTSVQLLARRLGTVGAAGPQNLAAPVGPPYTAKLDREPITFTLPFVPDAAGPFVLQVKAAPFEDEVLEENNLAEREITVQDESLRVLFVEYEPTWEWRFIKEVFHRDPLVGMQGFRTFLRSADFQVRGSNPMFLETLVRPRSEFFANDVIFLSDVPADMLSEHFQDLLREYVGNFGGGLVVIAGPRFGPQALAHTRLAEMLPVIPDSGAVLRDAKPFALQLTPQAAQYDFMRLGEDAAENRRAWGNLAKLPWYQPVIRPHPLATVLAQHPTDKCVDGLTPQPLIAVRRYGKGEVIYLAFNETWRLRRLYGEKYYRQFWGQMMYHLGLSRALGAQKRFLVNTDRRVYQAGDRVRLTVEAYNHDFEPLGVPALAARILAPAPTSEAQAAARELSVPLARGENIYEASVPIFTEGTHRVLVRDPVSRQEVEVNFKVAPVTVERRSAVRNAALQQTLAVTTGGQALELAQVERLEQLLKESRITLPVEHETRPLWCTWLCLVLVLVLMFSEWTLRKIMDLS